jgi:hypothetical protein
MEIEKLTISLLENLERAMGSNPPLTLYKLLNILASLPLSASNCVQLQRI